MPSQPFQLHWGKTEFQTLCSLCLEKFWRKLSRMTYTYTRTFQVVQQSAYPGFGTKQSSVTTPVQFRPSAYTIVQCVSGRVREVGQEEVVVTFSM